MTHKKPAQAVVSKFLQVTRDKNFREPISKIVTKTLSSKKYIPNEDITTLGKSILQTNFKRFSKRSSRFFIPKSTTNETYLDIKKGLENNLFAKILASPIRMDSYSRAKLPRETLIKWNTIKENSSEMYSEFIDKNSKIATDNLNSQDRSWIIPNLTNKTFPESNLSGYTQKLKDVVSLMSLKGRHKMMIQDSKVKSFEIAHNIENTIMSSWQKQILEISDYMVADLKHNLSPSSTYSIYSHFTTDLRLVWHQKNNEYAIPMMIRKSEKIQGSSEESGTTIEFNITELFGPEFAESLRSTFKDYLHKSQDGSFYYIELKSNLSKSLQELLWSYHIYTRK